MMLHEIIFPFGHDALTFVSAVVTAVAALLILGIQVPHNERWRNFRRMRTFLVVSYLLLSLSNFTTSLLQMEEDTPILMSTVTLIVASFQALLFTAVCLTFIWPSVLSLRRLAVHVSAIIVAGVVLLVLMMSAPAAFAVAFWIAVACYVVQLAVYTIAFRRHFAQCVSQLEQHYDEDESGRLRWIKRCFYSALTVGIMALVFSIPTIGIGYYECFIVAYTAYYVYMCHCMYAYRINSGFIVNVVAKSQPADDTATPADTMAAADARKLSLDEALRRWKEAKLFTHADVSPDDVAAQLGTTRRYLAWYFTTFEHTTFRSWRLKLRIEEAERILRERPDVAVAELHELVGMGDRSNFHKHFRLATGLTPSEYKAQFGAKRS